MSTHTHDHRPAGTRDAGARRPVKVFVLMVVTIGAFYLLREHWNHLAGNWVYLLLLACPLMHLFHGHGGHVGYVGHAGHGDQAAPPETRKE